MASSLSKVRKGLIMLKKLLAIILLVWSITVLGLLSINQESIRRAGEAKAMERVARARATTRFLEQFYDSLGQTSEVFLTVIVPVAAVGILGVVLVGAGLRIYERHWSNKHHAKDGIFPLMDQHLRLPDGSRATLITNPNLLAAAQVIAVHSGTMAGSYQLPGDLLDGNQILEAMRIARQANNLRAMPAERGGGIRQMLSQATAPSVRIVGGETDPQPKLLPGLQPMTIGQAFQQSTPTSWILGRSATGNLARFDAKTDVHAAILGATGTGKSAGVGLMMLAHAMRLGWRIVILDGKGGDDWSPFARQVEYHESFPDVFPDQVRHLVNEYDNRRNGRVPCAPMIVVIEEYGDINDSMSRLQKASANAGLMTIIRKGRDIDMHLCFIDQYPDRWEPQLLQNTKAKFVHWLEDGTIVKQYKAHELAQVGEFFFRGERFNSFDMKPHTRKMLEIAAPVRYPLLIDGEFERLEYEPETESKLDYEYEAVSRETGGKWDELISRYIAEFPDTLGADLPRGTIAELARRMAAADGNVKPYENYKGEASEGLKEYRLGGGD